jgi:predicted ATPase
MKISKIEVQNFKNFDKQTLEFNNVHVIIGANASGKSNFIEIFEFLKKIKEDGIQKAINYFGGVNSLLNFKTSSRDFRIKIELDPKIQLISKTSLREKVLVKNTSKITYEIVVRTKSRNSKDYTFKEELLFYDYFSINEFEEDELGNELKRHDKRFKYGVSREFNETFKIDAPNSTNEQFFYADDLEEINLEFFYQAPFQRQTIEELNNKKFKESSILEYQGLFMPKNLFDFGIYDIDTKIFKTTQEINPNETALGKNGLYLRKVVKDILESEEQEQFLASVTGMLDFIEDIQVSERDSELELSIKERFNNSHTKDKLLSDGTVAVIALIVILYYQDKSIFFIEEPEHSLHPSLIDDIIRAVYDVAEFFDKQIVITTHSPDLLRHLKTLDNDLKDLIMISRNEEDGNSILEKPINKEMVKAFLEAELGIDELFTQNLLND